MLIERLCIHWHAFYMNLVFSSVQCDVEVGTSVICHQVTVKFRHKLWTPHYAITLYAWIWMHQLLVMLLYPRKQSLRRHMLEQLCRSAIDLSTYNVTRLWSNYVHIDPEIIVQPSGVQAPLGAANIIRYNWYKQVNVHENKYWIPYFHTEFMDCIKLFSLTSTCLPCRDKAAWGYKSNSLTKC